jgi:hypothetical protein
MNAVTQPAPSRLRIWYGIPAAPVAFGIQEVLSWLISSGACPSGAPADIGGIPLFAGTRAILWGIAAAALLIALGALWVGISAWRGSQDPSFLSIRAQQRPDYMAAAAMLVSAVFTVAILWEAAVIFVLPQCETMR